MQTKSLLWVWFLRWFLWNLLLCQLLYYIVIKSTISVTDSSSVILWLSSSLWVCSSILAVQPHCPHGECWCETDLYSYRSWALFPTEVVSHAQQHFRSWKAHYTSKTWSPSTAVQSAVYVLALSCTLIHHYFSFCFRLLVQQPSRV